VTPGISSFVGPSKVSRLKDYFQPFLTYILDRIEPEHWSHTYTFLYATAGMRLLSETEKTEILSAIRHIFVSWPFVLVEPESVRIITGVDEGIFGWMTTNYLAGTFALNDPMATFGALDLGGASTQITFVPASPVPPSLGGVSVTVGGVVYNLYSVSYLGYGVDQARIIKNTLWMEKNCGVDSPCSSVVDFCIPKEWIAMVPAWNGTKVKTYGGSDFTICQRNETFRVLNASSCASCPIGDVYQPSLRGKFYAMSAFYLPVSMWGLPGNRSSIVDIEMAALKWCNFSMSQLRALRPEITPFYLSTYCFTGTLASQLLRRYGFDPNDAHAITFADKIGTSHLSWTLGAMVLAAERIEEIISKYIL
jgi:apyrase